MAFKVVAGTNDKPMIILNYKGEEKHFCAEEKNVYHQWFLRRCGRLQKRFWRNM